MVAKKSLNEFKSQLKTLPPEMRPLLEKLHKEGRVRGADWGPEESELIIRLTRFQGMSYGEVASIIPGVTESVLSGFFGRGEGRRKQAPSKPGSPRTLKPTIPTPNS
jgi:hypothetical protein